MKCSKLVVTPWMRFWNSIPNYFHSGTFKISMREEILWTEFQSIYWFCRNSLCLYPFKAHWDSATRPPPVKMIMITERERNMGRHYDLTPFKPGPVLHWSFSVWVELFWPKTFLIFETNPKKHLLTELDGFTPKIVNYFLKNCAFSPICVSSLWPKGGGGLSHVRPPPSYATAPPGYWKVGRKQCQNQFCPLLDPDFALPPLEKIRRTPMLIMWVQGSLNMMYETSFDQMLPTAWVILFKSEIRTDIHVHFHLLDTSRVHRPSETLMSNRFSKSTA